MRATRSFADVSATVAFIDLAGFSAIADVYGDSVAIGVLEVFESMVCDALSGYEPPIKWIGDEAMLSFPEPQMAIQALGTRPLSTKDSNSLAIQGLPCDSSGMIRGR